MTVKQIFILIGISAFSFKSFNDEKVLILLNRYPVTFGNGSLNVKETDTINIRIYTTDAAVIRDIDGIVLYGYQSKYGQCQQPQQSQQQQQQQQRIIFEEPELATIKKYKRGNGYIQFSVIPKKYRLCYERQFELEIFTELNLVSKLPGFLKAYKFRITNEKK